jgi:hypothetical protein
LSEHVEERRIEEKVEYIMSEILDLSFLSEVERDLILNVLQRDEELRKADEKRIR